MGNFVIKNSRAIPADVRKICRICLPMDGFIKETAVSMLEGYCPDMIRELIRESDDMGITILDHLNEIRDIYNDVVKEYADCIHMVNILKRHGMEQNTMRIDAKGFLKWYFSETIDFLYGEKSEEYQDTLKYMDLLEVELGEKLADLLSRLHPVELMVYTSINKLNEFYEKEHFTVSPANNYFRVVYRYLVRNVERNLSDEELKSVRELGEYEEEFRNYINKRRIEI